MAAKKSAKKVVRKAAKKIVKKAARKVAKPAKATKAKPAKAVKAKPAKAAKAKPAKAVKAKPAKAVKAKAAPVKREDGPIIRQGDKAAFVRGLSRSMPASEVVEQAEENGMIISKAYVHNIRSAANKAARALMAKEGKKTVKGDKKKIESQFRELVITLGPARAKKLLSQVETSLSIAAKR